MPLGAPRLFRAEVALEGNLRSLNRDMAAAKGLTKKTMREIGAQNAEPKVDLDISSLNKKYDAVTARLKEIDAAKAEASADLDTTRFDEEAKVLEARKELLARNIDIVVNVDTDKLGAMRVAMAKINKEAADNSLESWASQLGRIRVQAGPTSLSIKQLGLALSVLGPVITSLVGSVVALAGSLGEALVGGATVAAGALGGFATTALGTVLAIKPVITELKGVSTAQTAYNTAVAQYGKDSTEAQDAQAKLKQTIKGLPPEVEKLNGAWSALKANFISRTEDIRTTFVDDALNAIKSARHLLPTFTRQSTLSFNVLSNGWDKWMKGIRSPEAQHLLADIMTNFRRSIPPLMDALGNLATSLVRVSTVGSSFLPNLVRDFDNWTKGIEQSTRDTAALHDGIAGMVDQFKSWIALLHATGRLLIDVLGGGAKAGQGLVDTVTKLENKWSDFLETDKGQQEMASFFEDSVMTTEKLASVLARMVNIFFNLSRGMQPIADGVLAFAKFFGDIGSFISAWRPLYDIIKLTGFAMAAVWVTSKATAMIDLVTALAARFGLLRTSAEAAAAAEVAATTAAAAAPAAGAAGGAATAGGVVLPAGVEAGGAAAAGGGAAAAAAGIALPVAAIAAPIIALNLLNKGQQLPTFMHDYQVAAAKAAVATKDWKQSLKAMHAPLIAHRKAVIAEQNAAERVQRAEHRVTQAVDEYGPKSTQAKHAEERLSKARREHRDAANHAANAENNLVDAQERSRQRAEAARAANLKLIPALKDQISADKNLIQFDKAQGASKEKLSEDTNQLQLDQNRLTRVQHQAQRQNDQLTVSMGEAAAANKKTAGSLKPVRKGVFDLHNPFQVATNDLYTFGQASTDTARKWGKNQKSVQNDAEATNKKVSGETSKMSHNVSGSFFDMANNASKGVGIMIGNTNNALKGLGMTKKQVSFSITHATLQGTPGAHAEGGLAGIVPGTAPGDRHTLALNGMPLAKVESGEGIYVGNRTLMAAKARENAAIPRRAHGGAITASQYPISFPTNGRTDMGVDFAGSGPVVAMGDAQVVSTSNNGWPGTGGLVYRLLGGAPQGISPSSAYIYHYEGMRPSVGVGKTVKAGQRVGSLVPPPYSSEMGFWDPAQGNALAASHYSEGEVTAEGSAFKKLLQMLLHGSGVAGGGGIAQIARMILKGPPGPVRDTGQGSMDRVWHAANDFLAAQSGLGAGVKPGGALKGGRTVAASWFDSGDGSIRGGSQMPYGDTGFAELGWTAGSETTATGLGGLPYGAKVNVGYKGHSATGTKVDVGGGGPGIGGYPRAIDIGTGLAHSIGLATPFGLELVQVDPLRKGGMASPPYGGSFAYGGTVPGPPGEARTVVAHGGEPIGRANNDVQVHIHGDIIPATGFENDPVEVVLNDDRFYDAVQGEVDGNARLGGQLGSMR